MTVRQHGVDSSGRPIYASDKMWDWWTTVVADLPFAPVVVQGAWMSKVKGGGADASAGYHDRGGCFDLRSRDLAPAQVDLLIRVLRVHGAAAWRRDQRHGMDPHVHFVLGADDDLAPGAARQWQSYLNGRDGLAGNGPDYEWRPNPLVTTPPTEDDMNPAQEKTLNDTAAAVKRLEADLLAFRRTFNVRDKASQVREIEAIRQGVKANKSNEQIAADVEKLREESK